MDDRKPRDPLANLPGYVLRRAANAMMTELSERLATIDLKISDASVLLLIDGVEDRTSTEIGKLLDIKSGNMVPLLNRLESAGLIARRALDKKSHAIVLTPDGHERLAAVQLLTSEFEDYLVARIPEKHRAHFLPALRALIT